MGKGTRGIERKREAAKNVLAVSTLTVASLPLRWGTVWSGALAAPFPLTGVWAPP